MGKKRNRVVQSSEEEYRSKIADQMLDQGRKNFEKVYGSKTLGSFDLNADKQAMRNVGIIKDEEMNMAKTAISEIPVPTQSQQMSSVQFQPMPPQQEVQPQEDEVYSQENKDGSQSTNKFQEELLKLWQLETAKGISFNEWLDTKKDKSDEELSEDPIVRTQQIAKFIAKTHPNAPTAEMLQSWRHMHGDIFMLNIADRIFIYRYLKRQEWIQLNADPNIGQLKESQIEQNMFDKCVLWPQLNQIQQAGMPAGAVGMIVQQIRLQSLFLDPSYVAQLTIKI